MNKKEKVQIGVVLCSVLLIIISIIGDTYAYFTANIKKENVTPTVITTGTMRIEYTNSEEITGEKILPGWVSEAKTFTVKNTGTLPVDYDINITNVTNTFAKPEELVFTLTKNGTAVITEEQFPTTTSTVLSKNTIEPNTTDTYTLTVTFKELGVAQDYNQEKEFRGKIEITEHVNVPTAVTTLTELAKTNTTQMFTDDTEDKNIRYMGANPNNYVDIGNGNDADGNPILWRIIGVMNNVDDGTGKKETRLKVIREESIGDLAWDEEGYNNWSTASLNAILNGDYFNKQGAYASTGIGENPLIDDALYYLVAQNSYLVSNIYASERNITSAYNGNPLTWTGKVGLMDPSDYGYATSGGSAKNKEACVVKGTDSWNESDYSDCMNNDWLYISNIDQWTIVSESSESDRVYHVYPDGRVMSGMVEDMTIYTYATRPVVYLKADVKIIDGDGTKENPYKLGL